MALGPKAIRENRQPVIDAAERLIDAAISKASETRVTIDASLLKITPAEWRDVLVPKYRAAGWLKADWTFEERDGDFIDLDVDDGGKMARDHYGT